MSAVCGIWRPGAAEGASGEDSALVSSMLARVAYRGDTSEVKQGPNVTLGIHNWASRQDGEIIEDRSGYLAHAGSVISPTGNTLDGLRRALEAAATTADLDGAFTYLVASPEGLGVVRDRFGFKPLMVTETEDFVAAATEEIALRRALPGAFRVSEPPPGRASFYPLAKHALV